MPKDETYNNRYTKLDKLGEGSQGTVFKVEDLKEKDPKLKM